MKALILSTLIVNCCFAQIDLSEIMFNPVGNERYDEFIELVNLDEKISIDLTGYLLSDGSRFNRIIAYKQNAILLPQQYAIIFVPNYYEKSSCYENKIPESTLLLTIDHSQFGSYGLANNRAERVGIFMPDSSHIASYSYTPDNQDGFSEEKICPGAGNEISNWGNSIQIGGTPGYRNSISPFEYDIGIKSMSAVKKSLTVSDSVIIEIVLENCGIKKISNCSLDLFITTDYKMTEILSDIIIRDFSPKDSLSYIVKMQPLSKGEHKVFVTHNLIGDRNVLNDSLSLSLIVHHSFAFQSCIFNEIMYETEKKSQEWIEIFNRTSSSINLKGWSVKDKNKSVAISSSSDEIIQSHSFCVICNEPVKTAENVLQIVNGQLPELNNGGDELVLCDESGTVIDSMIYNEKSGGGRFISLERVNENISSVQQSNWAFCLHPDGHTMGAVNSVSIEPPEYCDVFIHPNPFSPDGDGFEDSVEIFYSLSSQAFQVNIKIFDMKGRLVRFLLKNEISGPTRTVLWDGLNDEGFRCTMGIYIVLIEALNNSQKSIETMRKTVVLASLL